MTREEMDGDRSRRRCGMRRGYYWDDHLVVPEALRAFAWSAPMRELAARLDMSDVGLRKLLVGYGIVPPPQGYWNKLRAGKRVPALPPPPPRGPGESGRLRVDRRFAGHVPAAEPMNSAGPFASMRVPDDLEELRARELRALGKVSAPKSLERHHPALGDLLRKEERRRQKSASTGYTWNGARYDGPLDQRRLQLLSGLFLALARRGQGGSLYDSDDGIEARAIVGDTGLALEILVSGDHRAVRRHGHMRPVPELPASTKLELRLEPDPRGGCTASWRDDADERLERKLGEITAAIIVAGEAKFRRSLVEAEAAAERQRVETERRRREERVALELKRLEDLRHSGELLRQAEEIRLLVERLRAAVVLGAHDVAPDALAAWTQWALAEADRLDPIASRQIDSHLRPAWLEEQAAAAPPGSALPHP